MTGRPSQLLSMRDLAALVLNCAGRYEHVLSATRTGNPKASAAGEVRHQQETRKPPEMKAFALDCLLVDIAATCEGVMRKCPRSLVRAH